MHINSIRSFFDIFCTFESLGPGLTLCKKISNKIERKKNDNTLQYLLKYELTKS